MSERSRVRRAILPCGGKGTRMASLTHGRAKELLEVAGAPVVEHVLAECAASGITEAAVISAPGKDELDAYVRALAGRAGMPARIDVVLQHDAHGLADAIRCGRDFAGDEPVAVALPDNLFVGAAPAVSQVIDAFDMTGANVVGVTEVTREDAAHRGPTAVYPGTRDGDLFRIERIPDKGAKGSTFDTGGAASAMTGVGRYVFLPDAFATIDAVERTLAAGAELDDIPVMQQLLAAWRLVGRVLHGRFLDVGLPSGFAEANDLLRDS